MKNLTRRSFVTLAAAPALAQAADRVERWGVWELAVNGPAEGNPFVDVSFGAVFAGGARHIEVGGFYDGGGVYRLRFSPDTQGEWTYQTRSNRPELNGKTGRFVCAAPSKVNHGPVVVRNQHHFAYADGTPYFPFGTTCYAWTHQGDALEEQTLRTLAAAPFNKMRMCIFPKSYAYNVNEPVYYPFARDAAGKSGFAHPNPEFFAHIERRITGLQRLGMEADLILFHPYDRWGYQDMGAAADDRYLRYVIARLASFRNVWWSMANEYNFLKKKTRADWERLAGILNAEDPYRRLASIHNGGELENMYDHSKSWITHVSLQSSRLDQGAALRNRFGKPVLYDECKYEGNIPKRWGDISARELVRRFWMGTAQGCYVGHGETYMDPEDVLWWSKGGVLRGESPRRIGFLRRILEETAEEGFAPLDSYYPCSGVPGKYYLYYFDVHQPVSFAPDLPAGKFSAELIDPWEMTVSVLGRDFERGAEVKLQGRPHLALRVRRL